MRTKLAGYGLVPHRPRKRRTKGLSMIVESDIAVAVKKLAISMDVSCTSVINAILRKALKL